MASHDAKMRNNILLARGHITSKIPQKLEIIWRLESGKSCR
jgi:hypothetical protein